MDLFHVSGPGGGQRLSRAGRYGWLLAVVALLGGCTAEVDGLAIPAADLGHDPTPVSVAALDNLLLPPEQLDVVLKTRGLAVKETETAGQGGKTAADDCAAVWRAAWRPAYAGSGWTAMRLQYFEDPPDGATLRGWQGVVSFPLPIDAKAFYAKQVAGWGTCNNRRLEQRYLNEPPEPDDFFKLGQVNDHDGLLTISSTEEAVDTGWGCERALTVGNNVAVDIQICGSRLTGQAKSVATAIAAKVPVK